MKRHEPAQGTIEYSILDARQYAVCACCGVIISAKHVDDWMAGLTSSVFMTQPECFA